MPAGIGGEETRAGRSPAPPRPGVVGLSPSVLKFYLGFPRCTVRAWAADPSGLGQSRAPSPHVAKLMCICGRGQLLWSPWPQLAMGHFPSWDLHRPHQPLLLLKGPWLGPSVYLWSDCAPACLCTCIWMRGI